MIIDADTATANWRKSWPLIPGMNATGTNTDSSTRVMAMIGPVISRHRLLGRGGNRQVRLLLDHALDVLDHDDGIVDDDADGEHQREQRDGVGRIADQQHDREGADDRYRHGDQRESGSMRSLPRNRKTTIATSTKAMTSVRTTSSMVEVTNTVVSQNTS